MKFSKQQQLSSELLVIDGMWGSGKSVITQLVSVFDSMECWRIDLPFDNIPVLYGMDSIEESAAITLIRNLFDEMTNNVSISRSVNFPYKDQTSVFNHPKKYEYILRLFDKGGDYFLKKIDKSRMIIPIATHMSSSNNDLFLRALGKRCKIIRCVRNPIFMIEHWAGYIGRCQTDSREFTLKIDHKGEDVPFFAKGWEDEYLEINDFEKSIKSISLLTDHYDNNFDKLNKKYGKYSVLEVSFESAVKDTDNVANVISEFINRGINSKTYSKVKKKSKLPRSSISSESIYANTDWKNNTNERLDGEADIIKKKLDFIKNKVHFKYYNELLILIDNYEKKWPKH